MSDGATITIVVGVGVGWFGSGRRGCDRMGEICVVAEGDAPSGIQESANSYGC